MSNRIFFIHILKLTLFIVLNIGTAVQVYSQANRISVTFQVNERDKQLTDNFYLLFLTERDTTEVEIVDSSFLFPELDSIDNATIVFVYKKYRLFFESIQVKGKYFEQEMRWTFKIDTKPFEYSNIAGSLEKEQHKIKGLWILSFNPKEYGVGKQIVVANYKKRYR